MAFCSHCGATLTEGARFCPSCGEKIGGDPALPRGPETPEKKKSLFQRPWFWVLALVLLGGALTVYLQASGPLLSRQGQAALPASSFPAVETARETSPTAPTRETSPAAGTIRPEVREFLDAYEAFMDEYVSFMERYKKADAASSAAMLQDYLHFLYSFTEYGEALNALDTTDLTDAELAYYLEVTSRVTQKLLRAAGR